MTAAQQLWIASLVAAVAFFVAGALVMTIRYRRRAKLTPAIAGRGPAELDQPRKQHGSIHELDELRSRVESSRSAEQQVRAELTTVQRRLAAAEAARTTAEAAHAALQTEHANTVARLRHAEVSSRQTEAAHDTQSKPHEVAHQRADQLQDQLREADRSLAERSAELRDAVSQLKLFKARVDDAEALRSEYVRLRTQANEMEFLTKEVQRLSEELKSAKSIALGGTHRAPRPLRPPSSVATGSITDALSIAIERFNNPQMRSIAIADNAGFPISSYGDDGVELAAYAALLNDVATRAKQLLPIATPASIEMVDEHGARISVWPFDVADARLLLVNLAIGSTDTNRVERMLSDVAGILAPPLPPMPPVPQPP